MSTGAEVIWKHEHRRPCDEMEPPAEVGIRRWMHRWGRLGGWVTGTVSRFGHHVNMGHTQHHKKAIAPVTSPAEQTTSRFGFHIEVPRERR